LGASAARAARREGWGEQKDARGATEKAGHARKLATTRPSPAGLHRALAGVKVTPSLIQSYSAQVTATRTSPTLAAPDVETVVVAVRARGLRVTASRRDVIESLFAAGGPVSAEEIASGLGGARPSIDDASVYANLETLEELGLVRHVHLGHGPGLWTLADRARREFLHCERCGASRTVEPSVLAEARAAIRRATGYEARFTHFPICGHCPDCARGQVDP